MPALAEPVASPAGRTVRWPRVPGLRLLGQIAKRPAGALGLVMTGSFVLVGRFADRIAPLDPNHVVGNALQAPSAAHRFGTDYAGRDEFTLVVHGVQTTMTVVLWAALISGALGLTIGATAGYRAGGLLDRAVLRVIELFQTIPRFFLVLLIISLFGATQRNIILSLGCTMWTLLARVVRSETLTVRHREYVKAARAAGARDAHIVVRHIIPNILPTATVLIALNASAVILIEAGLAFLGVSDTQHISLGQLISTANAYFQQAWWMSVFPGIALVIAVLGINLLADALGDVLDPRRRARSASGTVPGQ